MPVTVERLEPRIYLSVWRANITADDMQAGAQQRARLADEDQTPYYVYIVDVTKARSIPFNLEALRSAMQIDDRVLRFLVVGVTLQAHILIEGLIKLTSRKIEFLESREAALTYARDILAERDRQEPPQAM